MADKSSYLQYLPPVLWANEPEPPAFSLGAALRIFEKMLTGIADDADVPAADRPHPPITAQLDDLHRVFDPWQTPEPFLSWLASWVALDFPTLQGVPLWDEYQRRKVTAEIARIYRKRGLKAGLNTYLDLYAVGQTRPRVALDDGSRVLVTSPRADQLAPVTALVTQGPALAGNEVRAEGLIRPWCAATGSDGSLFVGDVGIPSGVPLALRSRVWRVGADGHYEQVGSPPKPRPLAPGTALTRVVAVAVRPAKGGKPETLYILDRNGKLYSLAAPYKDNTATEVKSLATAGTTFRPIAMCADPNGNLLVLDRGDGGGAANGPKIVTVELDPVKVTPTPLRKVVEPLSLLVRPDGSLIVGDGGNQEPSGPAQYPGNLVRVVRGAGGAFTETVLLPAANPLVAPTGLALIGARLYVLDAGLKPISPPSADPFVLEVAEPAVVYRVDLDGTVSVSRATEPGRFVYPTGMVAAGDRLVICDPGQPEVAGLLPFWSRVRPFQFDLVIHFAGSRLPPEPAKRKAVLDQAVGNIRTIIAEQKPAHTVWNLVTAIP